MHQIHEGELAEEEVHGGVKPGSAQMRSRVRVLPPQQ